MLCGIKYRALNNLSTFRFISPLIENIQRRTMSDNVSINIKEDAEDLHKNNKRHMNDVNLEVLSKIQKVEDVKKVKRKNYALMLGYLGKDYYGMQRNPGMKTIEEELILALRKADVIPQEAFENIKTIQFQRAARTDKGVSAVRQVINLKLVDAVEPAEINQYLPNEIRVFGLRKVTKGFNSKNRCDGRTYRYILPTHAFAPENPSFLQTPPDECIDEEKRLEELSIIDGKPYTEFRISPEIVDKMNAVMKSLEGTHNFHNFTTKVRPLDPRAKRYIISFSCVDTFVSNNMEFATLEIKGQSFMLHQIRKMVSVVIGITRNMAEESIVNKAFEPEKLIIPTAPSLGLSLNYVHYDHYNLRFGNDGIHESLEWEECTEEVEKFQKEYIVKHIVDTEIAEKTTLKWLASLTPCDFTLREECVAL